MIYWSDEAWEELKRLPRDLQMRILKALRRLDSTSHGDLKRLKGIKAYRLRVGKYRVILEKHGDEIYVLHVLKREDAYGDLTWF